MPIRPSSRAALALLALSIAACDAPSGPADSGTDDGGGADGPATSCAAAADCDDGLFCNGTEACAPGTAGASAFGCVAGTAPCTGTCSEAEDRCDDACPDADGDGVEDAACGGEDCNDADARAFPGNTETCDPAMHDEDCDPTTYGVRDADMDTWPDARCCNVGDDGPVCGEDCNDTSASAHPAAPEVCDLRDNDCDGRTDEAVVPTFYRDADMDGYGIASMTVTDQCLAPSGYVAVMGDCNDAAMGIHPGAFDECDPAMVDENCNGVPNDPPGGCACTSGMSRPCPGAMGVCATGVQPCTGGVWGTCSVTASADDDCDATDDDCDGRVDEMLSRDCYPDADGDGFAAAGAAPMRRCDASGTCPALFTATPPATAPTQDCDDGNAARSPVDPEVCNGVDDDCDALIDDGLPTSTYYVDTDGDGGHGTPVMGCMAMTGWSATETDCNEARTDVHDGQTEFFQTPYCVGGFACYTAGAWRCYLDAACTMSDVITMPSWDYDCDRVDTRPPTMPVSCPSSFFCSEGGWDSSAACGTFLPSSGPGRWYCVRTCSLPCSACGPMRENSYQPCR